MIEFFLDPHQLPLIFATLMGFAMLMYAILDGYDLGVGILICRATDSEKDIMIGSIGPFWDANETWLVLGVGLLLVAFPKAHGIILTNLYLPVAFMLTGIILRGVAFEFRIKAKDPHKDAWNRAFFCGSLLTAFSQGAMLGFYILGFEQSLLAILFSLLIGICVTAGYTLIGAAWIIMKTTTALQQKALQWGRYALWGTVIGIVAVSLSTPLVSDRIFQRWFVMPNLFFLAPIPLLTGILILRLHWVLDQLPCPQNKKCSKPFFLTASIFGLCFLGLAYSFYPYIVPNQLKINEAAASLESLQIILVGALIVLPFLIAYTTLSYRIFRGKSEEKYRE